MRRRSPSKTPSPQRRSTSRSSSPPESPRPRRAPPVRSPDHTRRVVVTGLGVVSSVGNDVATAWSSLVEGRSGLAELTRFDVSGYDHKAGGEVKDFDAAAWMDPKAVR